MALSPSDGQDAAFTLECGNGGRQGEHPRKRSGKRRFSADRLVESVRYCAIERVLDTPLPGAVTELLRAWGDGDDGALEQLTPLVEVELRRLARGYMRRERRGHTLQTTALVNEAFLRLTDARRVRWQDRAHFLGISARLMRRVLVDHARSHGYRKRGGGAERVTLHEGLVTSPEPAVDVLALDRALDALAAVDVRKGRVIELRFFGGLSVEETAEVLHVSADTVKRDWRLAKLWLLRELEGTKG
jgi:RNA polymerase sigma-70 factor (ECF subfamily)